MKLLFFLLFTFVATASIADSKLFDATITLKIPGKTLAEITVIEQIIQKQLTTYDNATYEISLERHAPRVFADSNYILTWPRSWWNNHVLPETLSTNSHRKIFDGGR
jgi:hypothetical protein